MNAHHAAEEARIVFNLMLDKEGSFGTLPLVNHSSVMKITRCPCASHHPSAWPTSKGCQEEKMNMDQTCTPLLEQVNNVIIE